MNKIFKRIGAILLALTLCFGTTLTAFAAEEVPAVKDTVILEDTNVARSTSVELSSVTFYPDYADNCYLSTSRNANFIIAVSGNPNGLYRLTITYQDGTQIYSGTRAGNGSSPSVNLYAKAGTYTFSFQWVGGVATSATAVYNIL